MSSVYAITTITQVIPHVRTFLLTCTQILGKSPPESILKGKLNKMLESLKKIKKTGKKKSAGKRSAIAKQKVIILTHLEEWNKITRPTWKYILEGKWDFMSLDLKYKFTLSDIIVPIGKLFKKAPMGPRKALKASYVWISSCLCKNEKIKKHLLAKAKKSYTIKSVKITKAPGEAVTMTEILKGAKHIDWNSLVDDLVSSSFLPEIIDDVKSGLKDGISLDSLARMAKRTSKKHGKKLEESGMVEEKYVRKGYDLEKARKDRKATEMALEKKMDEISSSDDDDEPKKKDDGKASSAGDPPKV